jgi:hypothetical protein
MVIDSGIKHWRWPWQRTCQGCGQKAPCFVVLCRRAAKRERRQAEAADPCACTDCRRRDEDDQASLAW